MNRHFLLDSVTYWSIYWTLDRPTFQIVKKNIFQFQLRLDLNTFVITGPTTVIVSAGAGAGGSTVGAVGLAFNSATNCLTDQFSVTGVSGALPPVICGTNSGYHCEWTISIFTTKWDFVTQQSFNKWIRSKFKNTMHHNIMKYFLFTTKFTFLELDVRLPLSYIRIS